MIKILKLVLWSKGLKLDFRLSWRRNRPSIIWIMSMKVKVGLVRCLLILLFKWLGSFGKKSMIQIHSLINLKLLRYVELLILAEELTCLSFALKNLNKNWPREDKLMKLARKIKRRNSRNNTKSIKRLFLVHFVLFRFQQTWI